MQHITEAFLDIETTGLSPADSEITVIGIYKCSDSNTKFIQLVGDDITEDSISNSYTDIDTIYTYNGTKFDLPFIASRFNIYLDKLFNHRDLILDCRQCSLFGGLKSIEKQLGIIRQLPKMSGYEAVRLWWQYLHYHDTDALNKLLAYNKEDVINLKLLRDKLVSIGTSNFHVFPPKLFQA